MEHRSKLMYFLLLVLLFSLIILGAFGCNKIQNGQVKIEKKETSQQKTMETKLSPEEKARILCIRKCQEELKAGKDLSKGPCLLNPIQEVKGWVCDVAHSPRVTIDNNPENQCSAFREGKANHFVEVSPECIFIRSL